MPVKKRVTNKDSSLGKEKKGAKQTKKASSAKPKRKVSKITKQERENIKQAVSSLPGLIIDRVPFVEEAAKWQPKQNEEPKKNNFVAPPAKQKPVSQPVPLPRAWSSPLEQKKRNLLWFLVGTLSVFILTLWIVNVRSQVSDANFNFGSEETLWQNAKEDFKTFVTPTDFPKPPEKTNELSPTEEEKIKQVLLENLTLLSVESTSTASSTRVSTSTILTTTTKE